MATFNLVNLTEADINTIFAGLSELPYKAAIVTIQKFQQQVQEQVVAAQAARPFIVPPVQQEEEISKEPEEPDEVV